MRGIDIDEAIDTSFLERYEVDIEYGGKMGTITIDDRELCKLSNYGAEGDMMDFLPTLSFLSGIILYYERLISSLKTDEQDDTLEEYVRFKAMPVYKLLDRTGLANSKAQDIPTDRLIESLISCLKPIKTLRRSIVAMQHKLNRLRASYSMVERAWETARSINANERSQMRG